MKAGFIIWRNLYFVVVLFSQFLSIAATAADIHSLAQNGDPIAFSDLLDKSGNQILRETNEYGQTAPFLAARNGHIDILEIIGQRDASAFSITSTIDKSSPMHGAAQVNQAKAIDVIFRYASDSLKLKDADGRTPAVDAVVLGNAEALEAIGKYDPESLRIPFYNGWTPAFWAITHAGGNKAKCLRAIFAAAPKAILDTDAYGNTVIGKIREAYRSGYSEFSQADMEEFEALAARVQQSGGNS